MKAVLAVIAIVLVLSAGVAFLYLAALGCGMATTGCQNAFLSSLILEGIALTFVVLAVGLSWLAVARLRR